MWLRIICFVTLAWTPAASVSFAQSIRADGSDVDVTSVIEWWRGKDNPTYLISYRYAFRDRANVHIKGLGTVPATGSFEYLSREPELEFRDKLGGAVISKVLITPARNPSEARWAWGGNTHDGWVRGGGGGEGSGAVWTVGPNGTLVQRGADHIARSVPVAHHPKPDEIADPTKFTSAIRPYLSELPEEALRARANIVLPRFGFLYQPHTENNVTSLVTTFVHFPVEKLPAGILAELALRISFPHDKDEKTAKYWFHISSLVMESRTHSPEARPTTNPDIITGAQNHIEKIVGDLKSEAQSKP